MGLGKNMNFSRHISNKEDDANELQQTQPELNQVTAPESVTASDQRQEITPDLPEYLESIELDNLKVTFTPSRRKTTRRISVMFEGDLTISSVTIIKDRLTRVFENFDFVDFVLKNINQIDLSAIQLFHVLKSVYTAAGKNITIDAQLSGDDRTLLSSCGLMDVFNQVKLSA